jgi:hypothetical protein
MHCPVRRRRGVDGHAANRIRFRRARTRPHHGCALPACRDPCACFARVQSAARSSCQAFLWALYLCILRLRKNPTSIPIRSGPPDKATGASSFR